MRRSAGITRRSRVGRPTTQEARDALAAVGRGRINAVVLEAERRGWFSCGDLCDSGLRRSLHFKVLPDSQRFALSWTASEDGCWNWLGSKKQNGYGQFRFGRSNGYAHRAAYQIHVGPIPVGLTLDHKCLNKGCVNPDHLEPVTGAENTRRWADSIDKCPAGHPYSAENTMGGKRSCRTCHNARSRIRSARQQVEGELRRRGRIRLRDEDIEAMRKLRGDGLRVKDIAELFEVTPKYASAVIAGSRKRRRNYTGPNAAVLHLLSARSGDRCEFNGCRGPAVHTHHRKPRRSGGTMDPRVNLPSNLVRLCLDHHDWVESNRLDALDVGLLLHANDDPSAVAAAVHGGLAYLLDDGTLAEVPS